MSGTDQRQLLKDALLQIRALKSRVSELERTREPIAIVGIACRVPGAATKDALWQMLLEGRDGVREVPAERWNADAFYDARVGTPGKTNCRHGGFIDRAFEFDCDFFRIAPTEARTMDPQQRVMMEVAWHALEDAGLTAERIAGTRTGVFIGACNADHMASLLGDRARRTEIGPYDGTGSSMNMLAGRLSYSLNVHGPAIVVDTACSSSLVAATIAVDSMRAGHADMAIVGGVATLLSPTGHLLLGQMGALSPTGRCRTFDRSADGFVPSEGAGAIVLKRLSDAIADGDRIYATIVGAASNQDGQSAGITAPSQRAQVDVMRAALANAGKSPDRVVYVETHGTGTPLGDPIEVEALRAVYGEASDAPCVLGALKSNIGHLHGAAGVGGLIKAALVLRHGIVPKNLHFEAPNPKLALEGSRLEIPTERRTLARAADGPCAAVSGFGWSGTNAHVVLEAYAAEPSRSVGTEVQDRPVLLAVSARSTDALVHQLESTRSTLATSDEPLVAFSAALASRRTHHPLRACVVARTKEEAERELSDRLASLGANAARPARGARQSRVAFICPGQGSQWAGMGRAFLNASPVFRDAFEEAARACDAHGVDVTFALDDERSLASIDVVQPTLFALSWALAKTWIAWGVEPDAVVGHSMGECAAAALSGVLTLQDAASVICKRSRLMRSLGGRGKMALVEATSDEVASWKRELDLGELAVSLAAHNAPRSVVVSGDTHAVERIAERATELERFSRFVKVDVASHSSQVDDIAPTLRDALEGLRPRDMQVDWLSTVSANHLPAADAQYWFDNLRRPVRFWPTMQELLRRGFRIFIELSAHPVLLPALEDTGACDGTTMVGSLRRDANDLETMLEHAAKVYEAGHAVDLPTLASPPSANYATPGVLDRLPLYPFDDTTPHAERAPEDASDAPQARGRATPARGEWATDERRVRGELASLAEKHRIGDEPVVMGAASFAWMFETLGTGTLKDVRIESTLSGASPERIVQLRTRTDESGTIQIEMRSLRAAGDEPTLHTRARFSAEAPADNGSRPDALAGERAIDVSAFYALAASMGLDYGPSLRRIRKASRAEETAMATIDVPEGLSGSVRGAIALDSALQTVLMAALGDDTSTSPWLVTGADRLYADLEAMRGELRVVADIDERSRSELRGRMRVFDEHGKMVCLAEGIRGRRFRTGALGRRGWRTHWEPAPFEPRHAPPPPAFVIVTDDARRASGCEHIDWSEIEALGSRTETNVVLDVRASTSGSGHATELARTVLPRLARAARVLAERNAPARVWIVTRSAACVSAADDAPDPSSAAVAGFSRSLAAEHAELDIRWIDTERQTELRDLLRQELCDAGVERRIAWRGDHRFVERIERMHRATTTDETSELSADGQYLLTGGTGDLGLAMARDLVRRGASHVTLFARRQPSDHAERVIRELESDGASVRVIRADMSERQSIERALAEARSSGPPIRGVIHAAGTLDDRAAFSLDTASLEQVILPKAEGATVLADVTASDPLDFFVFASSAAAVLPSPGQAHYAAANAFMDALATGLRKLGRPATSIQWGAWAEIGLVAREANRVERMREAGVVPIAPSTALGDQIDALGLELATVAIIDVNPERWLAAHPSHERDPFFSAFVREVSGATTDSASTNIDASSPEAVRNFLRASLAAVLGTSAARIDDDTPFAEYGLDSMMSLRLRNRLESGLGATFSATMMFRYPTVRTLVEHLAKPAASVARVPVNDETSSTVEAHAGSAADLLAEIEGMSDDEVQSALGIGERTEHSENE